MNLRYTFNNDQDFLAACEAVTDAFLDDVCSFEHASWSIVCNGDLAYEAIGTVLDEVEFIGSDDEHDQFRSDVEADADVLRSAGFGTDEDYEHSSFDEGGEG